MWQLLRRVLLVHSDQANNAEAAVAFATRAGGRAMPIERVPA
jgi:hypothetical protein